MASVESVMAHQLPARVSEKRRGCGRLLALAGALVLSWSGVAHPTMVVRMSLEQVTRESNRIVHAMVVDVQSGRDGAGLPASWITVDAVGTLKGGAVGRVVIKQYGVARRLADGTVARIAGLPRYTAGEEVVLFLRPDSRLGFTSPVGLDQGVYKVTDDGTGARVGSALSEDSGMDLDKFLSKVTALVAAGSRAGSRR